MKKKLVVTVAAGSSKVTADSARTETARVLATDPRWGKMTPGQQVLAAVIQQAADDIDNKGDTDFSCGSLRDLLTVVPQVKPALTAVFDKVDWAVLAQRRLTLSRVIDYLTDNLVRSGSLPCSFREAVKRLNGLLNQLDKVIDAAEKDGYPVERKQ